jgi:hypothetical protein
MGSAKRTRKFGQVQLSLSILPSLSIASSQKCGSQVKRIIGQRDARLKKNQDKGETENKKKSDGNEIVREMYVVFSFMEIPTMQSMGLEVANKTTDHKYPPPSSFNITPPSSPLTPSSSTPTSCRTLCSGNCPF